jgi:hypothetical protein
VRFSKRVITTEDTFAQQVPDHVYERTCAIGETYEKHPDASAVWARITHSFLSASSEQAPLMCGLVRRCRLFVESDIQAAKGILTTYSASQRSPAVDTIARCDLSKHDIGRQLITCLFEGCVEETVCKEESGCWRCLLKHVMSRQEQCTLCTVRRHYGKLNCLYSHCCVRSTRSPISEHGSRHYSWVCRGCRCTEKTRGGLKGNTTAFSGHPQLAPSHTCDTHRLFTEEEELPSSPSSTTQTTSTLSAIEHYKTTQYTQHVNPTDPAYE